LILILIPQMADKSSQVCILDTGTWMGTKPAVAFIQPVLPPAHTPSSLHNEVHAM
jgi:hypothetical protein